MIFTESAPLGQFSHIVAMSVCVSVCLCAPLDAVFFKAQHFTTQKLKCDNNQNVTKQQKKSNWTTTEKLKMLQNTKCQMTKLEISNGESTKNWNRGKIQTNLIMTKLKN